MQTKTIMEYDFSSCKLVKLKYTKFFLQIEDEDLESVVKVL